MRAGAILALFLLGLGSEAFAEPVRLYVPPLGGHTAPQTRGPGKPPPGPPPPHPPMPPDGKFVYASLETSQEVGVINTATRRGEARSPTGPQPHLTPASRRGKA